MAHNLSISGSELYVDGYSVGKIEVKTDIDPRENDLHIRVQTKAQGVFYLKKPELEALLRAKLAEVFEGRNTADLTEEEVADKISAFAFFHLLPDNPLFIRDHPPGFLSRDQLESIEFEERMIERIKLDYMNITKIPEEDCSEKMILFAREEVKKTLEELWQLQGESPTDSRLVLKDIFKALPDYLRCEEVYMLALEIDFNFVLSMKGDVICDKVLKRTLREYPLEFLERCFVIGYDKKEQVQLIISALMGVEGADLELIEKIAQYRNNEVVSHLILKFDHSSPQDFLSYKEKVRGASYLALALFFAKNEREIDVVRQLMPYRKECKDKESSLLHSFLAFQKELDESSIDDETRLRVLLGLFPTPKDSKELISRIQLLTSLLKSSPHLAKDLEVFNSEALMNLKIRELIEQGLIDSSLDKPELKFMETFLKSRIPSAIFTYIQAMSNFPEMKESLHIFIQSVLKNEFAALRNASNSHAFALTVEQKAKWEEGILLDVAGKKGAARTFNPQELAMAKLYYDRHGSRGVNQFPAMAQIIAENLKEGSRFPKTAEEFYHEMQSLKYDMEELLSVKTEILDALIRFWKASPDEELTTITNLKDVLKRLDPLDSQAFIQDLEDEIKKAKAPIKSHGKLTMHDTDDPFDLFLCGTEVLGSCQRVDGDPRLSKCLMGYVLDGKIRLIAIKDETGKIIARSILKIVLKEHLPVLFLEKTYPDYTFNEEIQKLAKDKAAYLGLPIYREYCDYECTKGAAELRSVKNVAPYEYEDGANSEFRINNGVYFFQGSIL